MHINTVLFDLDGTILSMDHDAFFKTYVGSLTQFLSDVCDPKTFSAALLFAMEKMIEDTNPQATNETVFYQHFNALVGDEVAAVVEARIDAYYKDHFDIVKPLTSKSQAMLDAIAYLKQKGYQLILATNPLLPYQATDKRIEWAGLNVDDFMDITRFEKNTALKPQAAYYEEIIAQNQLDPKTCLMVGNDVEEDLIAASLGMKTYLVTDDLIHRGSVFEADGTGSRADFYEWVETYL